MSKDMWYPWHPSDYLNDTAHLTPVEDLLYRRLLDVHWRLNGLPDDMQRLKRLSRLPDDWFDEAIQEVMLFFHREEDQPGLLFQKRMQKEIEDADKRIEAARRAGKASAESRAKNRRSTPVEPPLNSPPPPPPSQDSKKKPPSGAKKKVQPTGARLPSDWAPQPSLLGWARQNVPDVDLESETEKFRDYWAGVAGAKGRKLDWEATWRNWVRRAQDDRVNGKRQPPPQKTERLIDYPGSAFDKYGRLKPEWQ